MPKFNRKLVQTEPFQVVRDSTGKVVKVIFPHQVEFGFENDSNFQGQVSFKNSDPVDSSGGRINSEASSESFNLTSAGIGTALGFTPANVANTARLDFSNVSASSGRSALGVSDYVTGSLSDMFGNLNSSQVGSALGFTPANVADTARDDFSNVTASTGRSALGVSDHVTGSIRDLFENLNSSEVGTALGFTPANVSDTVRTDLSNAPSTILNSSVTKTTLGLGNVENKSSATIRGEISSDDVSGGLGFTPANVADTARSDFSNVTASSGRSALGIGDHVTGSLSDIFDNLSTDKVVSGLGFTPVNTNLSNAPSSILNSNITPVSLGLGNVENKSSATIRGEISSDDVSGGLGFTPANRTGANFDGSALSNIITSGRGENGYSIDYGEVGGFDSGDNQYILKVGASGVVGQRNINISTIYNSTSTTTITSNTTSYALTVENDSNSSVTSPNGMKITMDNAVATDDSGYFIYATIRGSRHYYVKSDGDGTSSVSLTFTGQHNVSCLKDPEMIPGMIVECTGESWVKNTDFSGEFVSYSTCLPRVKLSNTLGSKKVFGVLALDNNKKNVDGENNLNYCGVASGSFPGLVEKNGIDILDRHVEVMSLGEGCVWITDYNGEIECGDLIMTSPIKGYGCLQEDDIMRSKTVAKITEDVDWASVLETLTHEGTTYKRFLATCTFHCG